MTNLQRFTKQKGSHSRWKGGFTLAELLVTVAIIAILAGIGFLAASGIIGSMRQNKLDTIAQDIYVTAQQRLSDMYTDERTELLSADEEGVRRLLNMAADDTALKPADWDSKIEYSGLTSIYNKQSPDTAVTLLPEGSLSAEVYSNHWIIEYNPEFGFVYAVYYSEKGFEPSELSQWYTGGKANAMRTYASRKGSGVGYYGGQGVLGGKVKMTYTSLNATMKVTNAEELELELRVKVPTQYKDRDVRLTLTYTGTLSGATYQEQFTLSAMQYGYFDRKYPITLDTLTNGKSFRDQVRFRGMWPGEDVRVDLMAQLGKQTAGLYEPDTDLDYATAQVLVNSLFDKVDTEGKIAYVSAGRHLQNLNYIDSRVDLTAVYQCGNIDFKNTTPDNKDDSIYWWAETYPDRKFEPVTNSNLRLLRGSCLSEEEKDAAGNPITEYYTINGMTVEDSSEASGMFGTLGAAGKETRVEDIALVGSKVSGSGSVGTLAGVVKGDLTLINTGAYLNRSDFVNHTYKTMTTYLTGTKIGGLVGTAQGNVNATYCYSAHVLRAAANNATMGGLFGSVAGDMKLKSSYADCYLVAMGTGCTVGGLTGSCGSGSTIDNCYTSGFTIGSPAYSAGFAPTPVASMVNSYSVLNIGPNLEEGAATINTTFYTTAPNGTCTNVYYTLSDGVINVDGKDVRIYDYDRLIRNGTYKSFSELRNSKAPLLLSAGSFRFSSPTGDTTAYNLAAGLGLSSYPYPFIQKEDKTVLHHYGDWDGNLFDPGTLVYYEEYADGTRGYYGAGSNFLNTSRDANKQIVRDGYALLYTAYAVDQSVPSYGKVDATISFYGKNYTIPAIKNTDKPYIVHTRSITGNTVPNYYYFRDLPVEVVNASEAATPDFYSYLKVMTPDTKDDENKGESYYYFNPHFASTVIQMEQETDERPTLRLAAQNVVLIRSPRHLVMLSDYYTGHFEALNNLVTLEQEMDLDFTRYDWIGAGYTQDITMMRPIAPNAEYPFMATYDGKCHVITGVDFLSDTLNSGLFGYVSETGRLRNIVIAAQTDVENPENCRSVSYSKYPNQENNYAHMGVLAGYNGGSISNCAVAGYQLKVDTYYTSLYAGGLVGYNAGYISECSAETTLMSVRTNSCNAHLGSFVGMNSGSGVISHCYSLSNMNVRRNTSGMVRVGGFVGSNPGSIDTSYTATAMTVSNIEDAYLDGFAPTGGSVRSCYYLTQGTFKFINGIYAYGQSSATAKAANGISQLPGKGTVSLSGFGMASESNSLYHAATSTKSPGNYSYPFQAVVRNGGGAYTHYGDWITDDVFGEYGMLYWERETDGTNDGYHFYLVDMTGKAYSTLCTSHDDGGRVVEYGYGFYGLGDPSTTTATATATFTNVAGQNVNAAAEADLERQFANSYNFTLYTTSGAFADSPNGMYLNGSSNFATAKVTYNGETKTFSFNPFFASALQLSNSAPTSLGIRSIDQLQFLNWNSGTKNNKQYVTAEKKNYESFSFLGQATVTGEGKQTKNAAKNKEVFGWEWIQSHDIRQSSGQFTPIAGAATTSGEGTNYDAVLYAWFGSKYDGQSYKIENVNITSKCFTVGLFGVTVGVDMKNVVMYGTNQNAQICRSTVKRTDDAKWKGAYTIGGMIGVAYDYGGASSTSLTISNCAIAGYKIIDDSHTKQTVGEVNVGGLIGISNANLTNCSAVTDIIIQCTHRKLDDNGKLDSAAWGNYIRVGGLTGAALSEVKNCYTGGTMTVDERTLEENASNGTIKNNGKVQFKSSGSGTSVYLAGIGGSAFTQNYKNFTGSSGSKDGVPKFTNCYSYVQMPPLKGTIRAISMIGSLADRYEYGNTTIISNCYYLDLSAERIKEDLPTAFYYSDSEKNLKNLLERKVNNVNGYYYEEMLKGSSEFVNKAFDIKVDGKYQKRLTEVPTSPQLFRMTMVGLQELSISGFGRVTVLENGNSINGKYSFPGSVHELDGRNYPFPTVITQISDATGETVNVHYGEWPKGEGLYSSESTVLLDLLIQGADSKAVTLTNYHNYKPDAITDLSQVYFTFSELRSDGSVYENLTESEIVTVAPKLVSGNVELNIQGLKEGTVTIYANYRGYEAKIQVTVTAEFTIEITPAVVTLDETGKIITDVTPITDMGPDDKPTAYQQENLYWILTAENSEGTPLVLEPTNWRLEEASVDENFDTFSITRSQPTDGSTGEILLVFASNAVKQHDLQVTAFDVLTVHGDRISGSRSREISCVIKQNPPIVMVFPYPEDITQRDPMYTLYQVAKPEGSGFDYCRDKDGKLPVTELQYEGTPAGYEYLDGYVVGGTRQQVLDENNLPTGEFRYEYFADANGLINYDTPISSGTILGVYANWVVSEYSITYNAASYGEIQETETPTISAGAQTVYTLNDAFTMPHVTPDRVTGTDGRQLVFTGWKVTEDTGTWVKDTKFAPGQPITKGQYGNVTLDAIWNPLCTITYFDEGTDPIADVPETFTSYVADAASIRLLKLSAKKDMEHCGWKVRSMSEGAEGWELNGFYTDPILTNDVTYSGDVVLEACWDKAYYITYRVEGQDSDPVPYLERNRFTLADGPLKQGENTIRLEKPGHTFAGWKLATPAPQEGETPTYTGWEQGLLYISGQKMDNTGSRYTGDVILEAQWALTEYTITYDLNGGAFTGPASETQTYTCQSAFTLNPKPSLTECTFKGWKPTGGENWTEPLYDAEHPFEGGMMGDVTLTAQWEYTVHAVVYDLNGAGASLPTDETGKGIGWVNDNDQNLTYYIFNEGVDLVEPVRPGYTFDGWTQGSAATNSSWGDATYPAGHVDGKTGTVFMKAQWTPIRYTAVCQYAYVYLDDKVTVDAALTKKIQYTVEQGFELPAIKQQNGFDVSDWTVAETSGNWTEGSVYTGTVGTGMYGDVTLNCIRRYKRYNLTLDPGAGSVETNQMTYTYLEPVVLENATPAGYDLYFTGWTVADSTGTSWTGGPYFAGSYPNQYGDVLMTAGYGTKSLTLVAGYGIADQSFGIANGITEAHGDFDSYFAAPYVKPENGDYTLEGWYTSKNSSGGRVKVLNADGSIASDSIASGSVPGIITDSKFDLSGEVTLYARWKRTLTNVLTEAVPGDTRVILMNEKGDVLVHSSRDNMTIILYSEETDYKNKIGKTVSISDERIWNAEIVDNKWRFSYKGISGQTWYLATDIFQTDISASTSHLDWTYQNGHLYYQRVVGFGNNTSTNTYYLKVDYASGFNEEVSLKKNPQNPPTIKLYTLKNDVEDVYADD